MAAALPLARPKIPILSSIGLDRQETALVSTLFGPSQLAVRLFAGSLSERISPIQLTILSGVMLSLATVAIVLASHSRRNYTFHCLRWV